MLTLLTALLSIQKWEPPAHADHLLDWTPPIGVAAHSPAVPSLQDITANFRAANVLDSMLPASSDGVYEPVSHAPAPADTTVLYEVPPEVRHSMRPPPGSPPPPTSPSQIPSPSFAKRNLGKPYTPSPVSNLSRGGRGNGHYINEANVLSPSLISPRSAVSHRSNEISDVSSLSESGREDSPAGRYVRCLGISQEIWHFQFVHCLERVCGIVS